MKYQNVTSFFKHIQSSHPDHLLPCYGILTPDAFEKKYLADCLHTFFPKTSIFSLKEEPIDYLLEEMSTPSLFEEPPFIRIERDLKKKEVSSLLQILPSYSGVVLVTGVGKLDSELSRYLEKNGAILDLLQAKKWDVEKRLKEYVLRRAKKREKSFSENAFDTFFSLVSPDLGLLFSELDKLTLFVGEKRMIERSDIEAITSSSHEHTLWQMADLFVWKRKPIFHVEKDKIPLFLASLRYQYQMGYKIFLLQEKKEDVAKYFPKIYPKQLEVKKREAHVLGKAYFREGIQSVYTFELASRSDQPVFLEHLFAHVNSVLAPQSHL